MYDADGERVKRTVNGQTTTYYVGGLYEEDAPGGPNGTNRLLYQFNGQVVAHRTVTSAAQNTVHYLHNDHLGSVSVATRADGVVESRQEFDPWGKVRSTTGTMPTRLNYTGQRLDDTALLYYNARYYDPILGRFTSPDSIVPGVSLGAGGALGTVGAYQNHKLTVDFHESGFVGGLQTENKLVLEKGFWFQLSGEDKQKTKEPWGPINPQALNRYSYVINNPLRYMDPTGHVLATVGPLGWRFAFSNAEVKVLVGILENFLVGALTAGALEQAIAVAFGLPWYVAVLIAAALYQMSLDWLRGVVEQGLHLEIWQVSRAVCFWFFPLFGEFNRLASCSIGAFVAVKEESLLSRTSLALAS